MSALTAKEYASLTAAQRERLAKTWAEFAARQDFTPDRMLEVSAALIAAVPHLLNDLLAVEAALRQTRRHVAHLQLVLTEAWDDGRLDLPADEDANGDERECDHSDADGCGCGSVIEFNDVMRPTAEWGCPPAHRVKDVDALLGEGRL